MEPVYDVYYQNACMGQVQIQKEGLYYCLRCSAQTPGNSMYRLIAHGEEFYHDFGLCIPNEQGIGLLTRIPIKSFPKDAVVFELKDYKAKQENFFVPVNTDKEFPCLDQLENARLEYRNGVIGVCISD